MYYQDIFLGSLWSRVKWEEMAQEREPSVVRTDGSGPKTSTETNAYRVYVMYIIMQLTTFL